MTELLTFIWGSYLKNTSCCACQHQDTKLTPPPYMCIHFFQLYIYMNEAPSLQYPYSVVFVWVRCIICWMKDVSINSPLYTYIVFVNSGLQIQPLWILESFFCLLSFLNLFNNMNLKPCVKISLKWYFFSWKSSEFWISQWTYQLCASALCSKDLKDYMRQAGEVTYADAHKRHRNEG